MTNWLEENCTTLEQSKQLKELGIMDGVDADGYYTYGRSIHKDELLDVGLDGTTYKNGKKLGWTNLVANAPIIFPKYRLDKLLSELPRCYSDKGDLCIGSTRAYHHDLMNLFLSKGAKAIAAAVELILLLHKEGL